MSFQVQPSKLYIQDIFRAERTTENKYIYRLFGFTFKNIMIHGVVTSVYNVTNKTTNLEVSDPTGTVQVYFDATKSNAAIRPEMLNNLNHQYTVASRCHDINLKIMSTLMERIRRNKLDFVAGDFVSIVGDIFVDDKGMRMVSAFHCNKSTAEKDILWLEELRYMYDKFYVLKIV